MRVIVACESSRVVAEAFAKRGHDAWSCDLLPGETDGNHIIGDVMDLDMASYDLVIAHPPCTHLSVSGARWWKSKLVEQREAIQFFLWFTNLKNGKIAIENPIGLMSTVYRKPDQIIQPWQFGHPESKSTCLWLFNLPKLSPTNILSKPASGRWANQTPSGQNNLPPSEDRWKLRSRTYQGVADAMAEQWGSDGNPRRHVIPEEEDRAALPG